MAFVTLISTGVRGDKFPCVRRDSLAALQCSLTGRYSSSPLKDASPWDLGGCRAQTTSHLKTGGCSVAVPPFHDTTAGVLHEERSCAVKTRQKGARAACRNAGHSWTQMPARARFCCPAHRQTQSRVRRTFPSALTGWILQGGRLSGYHILLAQWFGTSSCGCPSNVTDLRVLSSGRAEQRCTARKESGN